jgi:hypothetical protein
MFHLVVRVDSLAAWLFFIGELFQERFERRKRVFESLETLQVGLFLEALVVFSWLHASMLQILRR